jgi:UDP-N-acetylmuramoyl-tripeptide--D-alanyl-D-alanine ligase
MQAALAALKEFPGARRRIAVLGSMGELGQHAAELHREVGAFAQSQGVDFLLAVGPHAEAYILGAMRAGLRSVARLLDADEAAIMLSNLLQEGDAVLVKGSHFMGLEKLVDQIAGKGPA